MTDFQEDLPRSPHILRPELYWQDPPALGPDPCPRCADLRRSEGLAELANAVREARRNGSVRGWPELPLALRGSDERVLRTLAAAAVLVALAVAARHAVRPE
ncbi:hypothetical protein [Streptomyces sp. NPDC050504]|uniref:hypothetical protein n=1 Tax=Streptomyces sp. NPDC050504 TaxID=3365618 RepID=UPI0037A4847C